jgi:tetratricopeptide (TPR) repeat protein
MKKCVCLCLILCSTAVFSQSTYIDSLLAVLSKSKEDTNKVRVLNDLSWEFFYLGENGKTILYANRAKTAAQKLNYTKGIAGAYSVIGNALYRQGNYPEAIENLISALRIEERSGNKKAISGCYNNIGNVYDSQEKYDESLKYYLKSLKIRQELKDSNLIAMSYHNIGLVYINQKKPDQAIEHFKLTFDLAKKAQDSLTMASCYHNMGVAYSEKKMLPKALEYALLAFHIREPLGNEFELLKSYVNLSADYQKLGKDDEAEKYALKALQLGRKMEYYELIMPVCQTLSTIYSKKKQYEKALTYHKEYSDARDSIISEESTAKTQRVLMNYEFEKKAMATQVEHDKKEAISVAVSKKQQVIIWSVFALFILAVVISLLIIRQNKFRSEQRTMQLEQKLLRSQMNPHFIFNSLTAIESFIYKSEPREAGRYLSGFARLMRLILENSREEFVSLEKEIQTLEHYLKLQKLRFDDSFNYSIHVSDSVDVSLIQIPPMLAQPFIENSIEHGLKGMQRKGEIKINFSLKNNDLVFDVTDNGVGFEKTLATKNELSGHQSLATAITNERLKNLNRKKKNIQLVMKDLKNSANETTGAKVTFIIPFTIG